MAAESSVPGPTGGWAGLMAGQTQRHAATVHCLQVAGLWRWLLRYYFTGVLFPPAETHKQETCQNSSGAKGSFFGCLRLSQDALCENVQSY